MTKRQRAMLRRIQWHWERYGFAPALRDLQNGWRSSNGPWYNLRVLKERGYVEYEPGIARSIRLTDAGRAALKPAVEEIGI